MKLFYILAHKSATEQIQLIKLIFVCFNLMYNFDR
jgi:hypothetical protein